MLQKPGEVRSPELSVNRCQDLVERLVFDQLVPFTGDDRGVLSAHGTPFNRYCGTPLLIMRDAPADGPYELFEQSW
jgi:hypothetical protein